MHARIPYRFHFLHQPTALDESRRVTAHGANLYDSARFSFGRDDGIVVRQVYAHGFLDQHMFSRPQRRDRYLGMKGVGIGDQHGVDRIQREQLLVVSQPSRDSPIVSHASQYVLADIAERRDRVEIAQLM